MLLTQAIMEVLKRHSSKEKTSDTKPLKQSEIVGYLKKEYPVEDNDYGITDKKVRTLLNKIIDSEISKADKDKSICYTIYEKKNGDEYKTDFWTPKSISDVELKYLIDAVMYSKIFDSATAQDLGRRIQDLSGKNFVRAQYLLQHPYNMGGNPDFFKLRVKREYLSRAVDTFSYETKVIANSTNENTVDIRVKSSLEGMKRWLLFNYDIAEVIEPPDELRDALIEASNDLSEKIKKII